MKETINNNSNGSATKTHDSSQCSLEISSEFGEEEERFGGRSIINFRKLGERSLKQLSCH